MGYELMGRELMSHESNLQLFLLCDSDTRQWYKAHLLEIETFRYITNGWFQKYPPPPPWRVIGNSRGVQRPKFTWGVGEGGERSNIFPEGPRTLSKGNLPKSYICDLINQQIYELQYI